MRHLLRSLFLGLIVLGLSAPLTACKNAPTIPGTEIPDTEDNRDILRVLERYRTAFVRRDAAGVLATAHPSYYDPAGTDDPTDDVVYGELGPILRERMAQLEAIRFTIDYLEINVIQDRASVKVWVDASFQLRSIVDPESGDVRVRGRHTRKQDHALFEMVNDNGAWRITRGL
ncbi:MAG: nuclear transport factor 2 family protein [Deltaproteobacteria bacterium]|nr:nuclear transport factor 2 family protein [Deltaproteobacteria bacterium]